jgi:hypothetical protein
LLTDTSDGFVISPLFFPNALERAIVNCRVKSGAGGVQLFHHRTIQLLLGDQDLDIAASQRGRHGCVKKRLRDVAATESEGLKSFFAGPMSMKSPLIRAPVQRFVRQRRGDDLADCKACRPTVLTDH